MFTDIEKIEEKINELKSSLDSLNGQCSLLSDQIKSGECCIEAFKNKKELYSKSVELLNLVSEATKEKTTEAFEKIVSYALKYIYGEEYNFKLEFDRHGSLPKLDFLLKSPKDEEYLPLLDCQAGGVLDVIAVALRITLLQLTKTSGYIIFDESYKHLHATPPEYLERVSLFLKEINKKFNRQIIMITGREQLKKEADNVIELGGNNERN